MSFPAELTNAIDYVTQIIAIHLNNLERKVGVDNSEDPTSLDYLVKNVNSINPGHTHPHIIGTIWFTSVGIPNDSIGINGDYCLDTSTGNVYNKQLDIWNYICSLKGVPGQTEDILKVFNNITVPAQSTVQLNLTGFVTRGLAHRVWIQETGGNVTGSYDVKVYDNDTFTPDEQGDPIYYLSAIDPTLNNRLFKDPEPWMFIDADLSDELHIEIKNDDTLYTGTYSLTIRIEKFA